MSAAQIACDGYKVELARLMEREIPRTPRLDKAESNRGKGKAHSLTFIANSDRKANWARWILSLIQNKEANMSADIRTAKAQDSDTIFEILRAAFQLESRPNGIEPARRMSQNDFASFLLLEEYGQTVGLVHIGRHRLQIGRSAIIKGDVGHVAIRPHLQGKGYGTKLMQNTIRFMGENGFHVTRLGGLMKFYSRFGYEPFQRRHIKIPVWVFQYPKGLLQIYFLL